MKRFEFLGFYVEFSKFSKRWFVIDWDYEDGEWVVADLPTKSAAMTWIERQHGL